MAEISTKPYLIRAIYEWCCDNGYTPHLVVKAGGRARLPMAYVRNGEIVLNVSPTATNGLQMGNDVIEFQARFNGVPEYVVVPVDNVLAIFARETGFVVPFNIGPAAGADADASGAGSAGAEGGAAGGPADAGAQPARPGQEGQGTSQGGQAGGGASAPAGGGDVVDFRAARAARPGLKAVPKPGDKDTSDASRSADEEGPKGRGTQADPAKGGATEGASDKGRDRSSSGSSVSPVGDASAPTEGDTPEKDEGGTTRGPPSPRPPAVASPRPAWPRAMLPHRPPLAHPARLERPPRRARLPRQGKTARGLAPRKGARPVLARNRRRLARVRPFPERRPRMARRIRRRPRRLRGVVPGWDVSSSTGLGSLARPRALPARIAPRALARHGFHGRFSSVGRATAL